ncbi:FMN-dependent NADH-azoreductase [Pseudodesulfovibrio piezophilus]|uniref:FMN dependent NADH:quinone oxidoreductase n=1 Tax=Pseudodesulfovibrio piezophilus (strain DSM 21447 / JCM 15486 / C1TLV30) TaxID=1322246 RepID=M1WNL3_PSEP2|nr:NAD(P)H-dependent oxidoreductase [Pseudodesulfovibrio piezophilus]CCH47659.1 FMN-dependent NADH-azoreductase [Pseudodesulfovibrio piezophilus C1TLV30]
MSKVLYIKASPRGARSHSIQLADAFIAALKIHSPDSEIIEKDLFAMDLPELNNDTLVGKYNIMHGRDFSEKDKENWASVEKVIEEFKAADKLVFAIPMWNFSIPYRLKHFMDIVAQPTYTFLAGPDGYKGLVQAKAFIAYSRGGDYTDDSPYNFQASYMKHYLGFIGVTDIQSIAVQPTLGTPEARDTSKGKAIERAQEIAKKF